MDPKQDSGTNHLPRHVGIIMDGNGRWAQKYHLPRTMGHEYGVKAAKNIILAASRLGLSYLSLYVFSTENWRRAGREVNFLMYLIRCYLKKHLRFYRKHNIRILCSGNRAGLPPKVRSILEEVEEGTASHTGLTAHVLINYGGRDEIIRAFRRYRTDRDPGKPSPEDFSEEHLDRYADQPEIPPPDLLIRTGGEIRLSNFLLWQSAYAELIFDEKFWPEWDSEDLEKALRVYGSRIRRYGAERAHAPLSAVKPSPRPEEAPKENKDQKVPV